MGYAIANEACRRLHKVILISGPTNLKPPRVKKFIRIETTDDLLCALKKEIRKADCLIMCAAVGDFRPKTVSKRKIKRRKRLFLEFIPNKDMLAEMSMYKKDKLFIGFSLETEDLIKNSMVKLKNKNLDLIVANRLSKTHNLFGNNKLDISIIDKKGQRIDINNRPKPYIAQVLLDKIERLWYLKENR
jgi:phosphopantothenoylcysteine decarboxylase/phosphopantothenate--cysteine ligase